ncbi:MAG: hypothetical protein KKA32_14170 [Actinobacteria bacterium]|nr:hypothetical protein [Actinomycetota bacterium]
MAIHCPDCHESVEFHPATMVDDNGWILEYDMELAGFHLEARGRAPENPKELTPEWIFDHDFSTWNGLTPTDAFDKPMEMHELMAETKGDARANFEALKSWTKERTGRLADRGWRKAKLAL